MKGLNDQGPLTRFKMHVADRTHGNAAAGIERVQHALSLIVLHELLLEGPKEFRIRRFQLKTDLIVRIATIQGVGEASYQTVRQQASLFWQRMTGGRRDFGKNLPVVSPCNDVPSAGNVNLCLESITFDFTRLQHFKQFGMKCAPVNFERKFCNFWSDDCHELTLQKKNRCEQRRT